jgi:2-C-methyl-D-erythritol 4-phosphate cytidylyltransferase
MQTPQVMRRADLLAALAACPIPLADVTDDVQLLEL